VPDPIVDPPGFHPGSPLVILNRIGEIRTYEIMNSELDDIDQIVAAENQALGFCAAGLGILFSVVPSWTASAAISVTATVIYAVATAVSLIGSLWFGVTWRRERARRHSLTARIKTRSQQVAPGQLQPLP
jgi:hypothetical protein